MNRTFALVAACCLAGTLAVTASAQNPIPNPGFENWSAGNPVDWATSNIFAPGSITQTSDAHSGSSAVQGSVTEPFFGVFVPPHLFSGDTVLGFPVSQRWDQLRGYYKFNSAGGDQLSIQAFLRNTSVAISTGAFVDSVGKASYTEFVLDLSLVIDSVPDTGFIAVTIVAGPSGNVDPASTFWLDDLSFSEDTSGGGGCPIALTGDVDGGGTVVTSDIIYLVNFVLKAGSAPVPCLAAGDVNCDGSVVTSDIIYLVNTVLKAGTQPCDVCTLIPGTWSCP